MWPSPPSSSWRCHADRPGSSALYQVCQEHQEQEAHRGENKITGTSMFSLKVVLTKINSCFETKKSILTPNPYYVVKSLHDQILVNDHFTSPDTSMNMTLTLPLPPSLPWSQSLKLCHV